MSLVLHPALQFTVVRQIANHLDSATYYVRAVIRNAYTDAILDTLDLTDRGSQRFSRSWQVPADPSGQGFYVSIVTSVYSDSGYTTKSENYGDEENTYLVEDKVASGKGGGGWNGLDAYRVRQIFVEEVAKIPKPEPVVIPEMPEIKMRWDEVLQAVRSLPQEIPEVKPVDLKPVLDAVAGVKKTVEDKPVTPAPDMAPLIEKHDLLTQAVDDLRADIAQDIDALAQTVVEEAVRAVKEAVENVKWVSSFETRSEKSEYPLPQKLNSEVTTGDEDRIDLDKISQ